MLAVAALISMSTVAPIFGQTGDSQVDESIQSAENTIRDSWKVLQGAEQETQAKVSEYAVDLAPYCQKDGYTSQECNQLLRECASIGFTTIECDYYQDLSGVVIGTPELKNAIQVKLDAKAQQLEEIEQQCIDMKVCSP